MFYHVVFEDFDTRIREYENSTWDRNPDCDFDTYEEARQVAIGYLEDLVNGCQKTLDELRKTDKEAYEKERNTITAVGKRQTRNNVLSLGLLRNS